MSPLVRKRYELLAEAGRGGQASVLRALDVVHQRQVVLKARPLVSEEERAGLLEEARILFSVRPHPNLPLLREDFVVGDRYYLVMDWIDGRDLRQVLRDEGCPGLPFDRVIEYLGQAAEALDHLHDHDPPVVHGDVKPANLILAPDGRVVLVDFGISHHRPGVSSPGGGSPGYAAPEAVLGAPTPASDIFGLAATTYTLLTGAPPRPGVRSQLSGLPDGGLPVMRALRRGLAIDPARRPATATALVEALRAAAAPAARRPLPARGRRIRRSWLIGTVATGVLAVAAVAGLRGGGGRGSQPRVAGQQAQRWIGIGDGLAACPEGYLCVWKDAGYLGGGVALFAVEARWTALPGNFAAVARQGSSFFNHGIPAPRDRLPDVVLYTAEGFTGESVCLPNGRTIEDAAGSPLDNAVGSNRWVAAC
jgi:tRNA A-37 threonylcarbamoyl transferase component Bud32